MQCSGGGFGESRCRSSKRNACGRPTFFLLVSPRVSILLSPYVGPQGKQPYSTARFCCGKTRDPITNGTICAVHADILYMTNNKLASSQNERLEFPKNYRLVWNDVGGMACEVWMPVFSGEEKVVVLISCS